MNAKTFARIAAAVAVAGIMALGAQTATAHTTTDRAVTAVAADSAAPTTTTTGNPDSDPWD